jgi:bifunctional non-homologous end joining protein LigD
VAAPIVTAHPELATFERRIEDRPRGTIYVDVQQNARGKSVVSAYSARARKGATVSAPLRWLELTKSLTLERFTVRTMPRRLTRVGDLWGDALRAGNRDATVGSGLEQLMMEDGA